MRVTVELEWEPAGAVTLDAGGRLRFPTLPAGPGIHASG